MAPRKGSHPGRWTPEKIAYARELYAQGWDRERVAEAVGMSGGAVTGMLRRFGETRKWGAHLRKYHPREDAFDSAAADETKSYWLGFLFADGNVFPDPQGHRQPAVRLELGREDIEHVRAFAAFLGLPPESIRQSKRDGAASVSIRSQRLADSLASYGIVPNKSALVVAATPIGMELNRHFFRGLIDGDGCLSSSEYDRKFRRIEMVSLSVICSKGAVEQFADYVRALCPECRVSVIPRFGAWTWGTMARPAMMAIRDLYRDCTVALPRKLALAQRLLADLGEEGMRDVWVDVSTSEACHPRGQVFLELNGVRKPIAEWSRETGIPSITLQARKRYGWSDEEALTTPIQIDRRKTLVCSVAGCGGAHVARGFCSLHYKRWRKGAL